MTEVRRLGLLSVVAPVLNEEEVLETFYERVRDALEDVRLRARARRRRLDRRDRRDPRRARRPDDRACSVVTPLAQLRLPGRGLGGTRPRARRRGGDDRRRPPGPARADRGAASPIGARAPTSSTRCARAPRRGPREADHRALVLRHLRQARRARHPGERRRLSACSTAAPSTALRRCPSATASCAGWPSGSASRRARSPTTATRATWARRAIAGGRCCGSRSTRSRRSRTCRSSSRR